MARPYSVHNRIYYVLEHLEQLQNDLIIMEEEKPADTVGKMIDSLSRLRVYTKEKYMHP